MASAFARFYREGFRNVALDQIIADVGISKTAFYKHFDSKEDLMVAALEAHHEEMEKQFLEMVRSRGGESPLGQLRALFDAVETILDSDGFHGCVFVNASIEFPLPHEPAHIAAAKSKAAFQQMVCRIAQQAGAEEPQALAAELMLIMEGAYVTSHVTGDPLTIHVARRLGDRAIDAYIPAAARAVHPSVASSSS